MDDKYENMSFDELTKLSKDGDRDAEAELKLREMSEEEPPPRIPKGVSMDNLTNEQMDEFFEGKRGYTQGKDYPKEEAEKAMKKEEEFQIEEEVSAIRRKDDELALQQFEKLKDAELYADMAEQLYGAGFTADVVAGILGMGIAKGATVGKETVEGTFATAEKMVKDPTLPREFLPYDKERIMKNLQDYRDTMMKRSEYVDVPKSYVPEMADVPTATRKAKAAENILVRMGDESVGARIDYSTPYTFIRDKEIDLPGPPVERVYYPDSYRRAKPVEGYEGLSSYLKKYVPKSAFGESKMGTRPSRKPTEVKGEMVIPASTGEKIASGGAAMFVPGYDAYQSMSDAQRAKKTVREQQQKVFESASPEVKAMIEDKLMGPEKPKREFDTDYDYR
tara:strand:+ start:1576 stop:2751 length:1176 start_codon:yes stop_codon:yes gene_type:complete